MKVIIILCGFIALTFAEIASSNKYDLHHTQHEQSVNAAKISLQERLSQIEDQNGHSQSGYGGLNQARYGNAYGSSGSQKYVAGCASCVGSEGGSENRVAYSSRQSSSSQRSSATSSGHGLSHSDYTGVGIVGLSNTEDQDDVQSHIAPSYTGGDSSSRYSSDAYEADEMQQRVVPADLSSVSSSAYRSTAMSEHDEDDLQRNVGPTQGGSRVYSASRGSGYDSSRTGYETSRSGHDSARSGYDNSRNGYDSSRAGIDSSRAGSDSLRTGYDSSRTGYDSSRTGYDSSRSGYTTNQQRSSSSTSETEQNELRKPIPTGQYINMAVRPGTATVIAMPVRVVQTHVVPEDTNKFYSRSSDHSSSDISSSSRVQNPTSTTYRVTYTPARNFVSTDKVSSSNSESESSRTVGGVQQPEKLTNYNSFNNNLDSASQTRYRADDSDSNYDLTQTRVAPVSVTAPQNGGSSRYASSGTASSQSGHTQSRVVPVFNTNTIESSSSSRTAEEKDQRRYTPASPTYISTSRVSASELEESRNRQASSQFGGSGTYYVPVSNTQTRTQTQNQAGSGSQTQYQAGSGSQTQYQRQGGLGGNYSPYAPSRSQLSNSQSSSSADKLSQRFGTGILHSNDDLNTYISESERLARLQQQQISGSSGNTASSNYDANRRTLQTASNLDSSAANFVRTSNLANRNSELDTASVDGADNGGYTRVKSWNKQSKWSSGSEYGQDGKPKTYSTLSTAEAEKYNINGAETGYKAATTTLENDGKVSTYSIHTP